ncbi:MAG: CvpA family protein, partial [Bacteroidales bacterium]
IASLLTRLLKMIYLNLINRLIGVAFGILKYAFLVSLLLIFVNFLNRFYIILPEEEKEKSLLYEYIEPIAPMFIPGGEYNFLPEYPEQKPPYRQT